MFTGYSKGLAIYYACCKHLHRTFYFVGKRVYLLKVHLNDHLFDFMSTYKI